MALCARFFKTSADVPLLSSIFLAQTCINFVTCNFPKPFITICRISAPSLFLFSSLDWHYHLHSNFFHRKLVCTVTCFLIHPTFLQSTLHVVSTEATIVYGANHVSVSCLSGLESIIGFLHLFIAIICLSIPQRVSECFRVILRPTFEGISVSQHVLKYLNLTPCASDNSVSPLRKHGRPL